VQDQAFFDRLKGESVCRSTPNEIGDQLNRIFGTLISGAVPDVGSIITDPRGEGALPASSHMPFNSKLVGVNPWKTKKRTSASMLYMPVLQERILKSATPLQLKASCRLLELSHKNSFFIAKTSFDNLTIRTLIKNIKVQKSRKQGLWKK